MATGTYLLPIGAAPIVLPSTTAYINSQVIIVGSADFTNPNIEVSARFHVGSGYYEQTTDSEPTMAGNLTLKHLTLGHGTEGNVIQVDFYGTVTIESCRIENVACGGSCNGGAPLTVRGGTAVVRDSTFANCVGGGSGAVWIASTGAYIGGEYTEFLPTVTFIGVDMTNNHGGNDSGYGGAVSVVDGSVTFTQGSISGSSNGAAITAWGGSVDVSGTTFSGNSAEYYGTDGNPNCKARPPGTILGC